MREGEGGDESAKCQGRNVETGRSAAHYLPPLLIIGRLVGC